MHIVGAIGATLDYNIVSIKMRRFSARTVYNRRPYVAHPRGRAYAVSRLTQYQYNSIFSSALDRRSNHSWHMRRYCDT